MEQHYLLKNYRKRFIKYTITWLIISIIVCGIIVFIQLSDRKLLSVNEVKSNNDVMLAASREEWLSVTLTDLYFTGFYVVDDEDEEKIVSYDFFAVIEGTEEAVMVSLNEKNFDEATLDNPPETYRIKFGWTDIDSEFIGMIAEEYFEGDYDQFSEVFTGNTIYEAVLTDFITPTQMIIFGVVLAVLLAIIIFNFIGIINPKLCNQYKTFKKLPGDLEANLTSVDREIRDGNPRKAGKVLVSKTWLLTESGYAYRNEEIIWVYVEEITHYRNGIKTGTSFKSNIGLKDGKLIHAYDTYDKKITPIFQEIMHDVCPYAIFGFSVDLKNMFNKQRHKMIAAVEENRQQMGANENFYESGL